VLAHAGEQRRVEDAADPFGEMTDALAEIVQRKRDGEFVAAQPQFGARPMLAAAVVEHPSGAAMAAPKSAVTMASPARSSCASIGG
jgi:hypothetical protein